MDLNSIVLQVNSNIKCKYTF